MMDFGEGQGWWVFKMWDLGLWELGVLKLNRPGVVRPCGLTMDPARDI